MKPVGKKQVIQIVPAGSLIMAIMFMLMRGHDVVAQPQGMRRPEPANTQTQTDFEPWTLPWYYFGDIYTLLRGRCGHDYLIRDLKSKSGQLKDILTHEGRPLTKEDPRIIGMIRPIIENDRPVNRPDNPYWWLKSDPYKWSSETFPLKIKVRDMESDELIITPEAVLIPKNFRTGRRDKTWLKEQMANINFDTLKAGEYDPDRDLHYASVFRVLEFMSLYYTKYFNLRAPSDITENKKVYNTIFARLLGTDDDERRKAIEDFAKNPPIEALEKNPGFFLPKNMEIFVHANKASYQTSIQAKDKATLVLNVCLTYGTQYEPPNKPSLDAEKEFDKRDPVLEEPYDYGAMGRECR